jgi:hypothetical protein
LTIILKFLFVFFACGIAPGTTSKDMAKIIMDSLPSYNIRWNHLAASLNFEGLRSLLGIDCHNLRNVHDLELFRSEGGIFCRWKQYMSDDVWSKPRLLVRPEHIHVVAKAVPDPIQHSFSDTQKAKFEDFLNKFEMLMASTNMLGEKEREGMKWLKKHTSTDMGYEMPLKQMISEIEMANRGTACRTMVDTLHEVPSDILYANCPGLLPCVVTLSPCHLVVKNHHLPQELTFQVFHWKA